MNETQFLSELRLHLIENNIDEADADKYAEQFKRYFENLPEDEIEEQLVSLGNMESIVSNLVGLINSKKARKEMQASEKVEGASESESSFIPEEITEPEEGTEGASENAPACGKTVSEDANEATDASPTLDMENQDETELFRQEEARTPGPDVAEYVPESEPIPEFSEADDISEGFSPGAFNAAYNDTYSDDEFVITPEPVVPGAVREPIRARRGRIPETRRMAQGGEEYGYEDGYGEKRGGISDFIYRSPRRIWAKLDTEEQKTTFRNTMLRYSPVMLLAALLGAALFLLAFAVAAVLFAGLIALLLGVTVAGTGYSLVSIVYGITQLFSVRPVGIYEIGIGIASAGLTMIAGIVVYNITVHYMPLGVKYLILLFTYAIDYAKGIVYRIRKECAK